MAIAKKMTISDECRTDKHDALCLDYAIGEIAKEATLVLAGIPRGQGYKLHFVLEFERPTQEIGSVGRCEKCPDCGAMKQAGVNFHRCG